MAKKFLGQMGVKAILAKSKAWADEMLAAAKTYADSSVGGVEIPTKVSQLANDSGFATSSAVDTAKQDAVNDAKSYTDGELAKLVGNAPENLDTLKEIADILDNSSETNIGLIQQMGQKANKSEVDAALGAKIDEADLTEFTEAEIDAIAAEVLAGN